MTSLQAASLAIVVLFGGGLIASGWWRDRHVRLLRRVCDRFARELDAATKAGDQARADVLRGMLGVAREAYLEALLRRR